MTSKIILFIVALLSFQSAAAAGRQKRSVADIPLVGPLVSSVTSRAENLIAAADATARQVLQDATRPLQGLLESVADRVKAVVEAETGDCVLGRQDEARSVVQQTGRDIMGCTERVLLQPRKTYEGIVNQRNEAMKLAVSVPSGALGCITKGILNIGPCVINNSKSAIEEALTLAQSITSSLAQLSGQVVLLPQSLVACSTDQLAKATEKVGSIISDIGNCLVGVARKS